MSTENSNTTLFSNRSIVRGFVVAVLIAGCFLILPLYMQNRLNRLYERSHDLSNQVGTLNRELLLQELEINKLSSLENLSEFAEESGLGLNCIPEKIRLSGGVK